MQGGVNSICRSISTTIDIGNLGIIVKGGITIVNLNQSDVQTSFGRCFDDHIGRVAFKALLDLPHQGVVAILISSGTFGFTAQTDTIFRTRYILHELAACHETTVGGCAIG